VQLRRSTAVVSTQRRSNLVSCASLSKTGIFAVVAGDFAEMACEFSKESSLAALLALLENI
jgi:hypothetical protein